MARNGIPARASLWNDPAVRAVVYQVIAAVLVIGAIAFLVANVRANLIERNIQTGYGFLTDQEAGFAIGESLIPFETTNTFLRAFVVGLLNTLRVAAIGIVLATVIGTVIGIARLSRNWLVAKLASVYVETVRNVPLLLQLFFWYAILTSTLPTVENALNLLPNVYLSNSGLVYPVPLFDPAHLYSLAAFVVGGAGLWAFGRRNRRRQAATGRRIQAFGPAVALLIGLPLVVFWASGAPTAVELPTMGRFGFDGGGGITPEFMALLLGLTLYTAGFIAEIVRSGILAVNWGQSEAALAMGLTRAQVLRLIVLPQAMRVIVPPMTSQYLNLTKNSSLAVAIGYPDLVSVADTTLNQTGHTMEAISIIMAVYLVLSLTIAGVMNLYNRRITLVER